MRVHARAIPAEGASAIGRIELECTRAGLSIALYRLAAYTEGYAPGPITSGFRVVLPYASVRLSRQGELLRLKLDAPGFPYEQLILSHFSAGPGVPPHELRQRRMILHLSALGLAGVFAVLVAALLARREEPSLTLPLVYGAMTALAVLGFGFSLDQRFFLRPPDEAATREAFVLDLMRELPASGFDEVPPKATPSPDLFAQLAAWLPTRVGPLGATLAAAILTLLVTGKAVLSSGSNPLPSAPSAPITALPLARPEPPLAPTPPTDVPPAPQPTVPSPPPPNLSEDELSQERTCLCDRADSPLWSEPLPRLSGLLLDSRVVPRATQNRLEVEVAVVNNGDEPLKDITLHVAFYEGKSASGPSTAERPLFFEGPLRPGAAVKWTTEAKGASFRLLVPDLGRLGQNGEGAASIEAFRELLNARNRPVRLHAARVLSFLGDKVAREAALKLKDAYRARESAYLRRVLVASGELRVCDVKVDDKSPEPRVSACLYNGSRDEQSGLGLWVQELDHALDPSQPLANPPELLEERKWTLQGKLAPNTGASITAPLSPSFPRSGRALELVLDRKSELE